MGIAFSNTLSGGRGPVVLLGITSTVDGVAKAVAAVIQSAASGHITAGEASDFCSLLETQRRVIELSDIETRLGKLEAAQTRR